MWTRLRHLWSDLISGYWFVPAAMTSAAVVLAFCLLFIDRRLIGQGSQPAWLYAGGADGAKTLLSAVAGSVITVAGVVFSITIVALTQASSQFGPRLLRNFMSDTANQVVLGTFVATFVYCLLVLRTIHGEFDDGPAFVPQASVTAAVFLALASMAVLIYFIHHVSIQLQAPSVIASALAELQRTAERLKHEPESARGQRPSGQIDVPDDHRVVASPTDGYLQAVEYEALLQAADEHDLLLKLEQRPGFYLIKGAVLLRAAPKERCPEELCRKLAKRFITGSRPTPEQDIEFSIRQLVEVAVRALSPGVNDPFTAINCIDALGSGLCTVARQGLPGPLRYGEDRRTVRLIFPVTSFDGLADAAFNQIRQHARGDVAVIIRLLETVTACASLLTAPEQRAALRRHAQLVYRHAQEAVTDPSDRADIAERWSEAESATEPA